MSTSSGVLRSSFSLDLFGALNELKKSAASNFVLIQQIDRFLALKEWTSQERKEVLKSASQWLLESSLTLKVAHHFRPIVEELVFLARRSLPFSSTQASSGISISLEYRIHLSSALSKLSRVSPSCLSASKQHFALFDVLQPLESLLPLLQNYVESIDDQNASESNTTITSESKQAFSLISSLSIEVLRTCWRLCKLGCFQINQSSLLNLIKMTDSILLKIQAKNAAEIDLFDLFQKISILSNQCLAQCLGISDRETQKMASIKNSQQSPYIAMIDEEDARDYELLTSASSWQSSSHFNSSNDSNHQSSHSDRSGSYLVSSDLQSGLVDVAGFLLSSNPSNTSQTSSMDSNTPQLSNKNNSVHQELIITPTTSHNLQALALAISNEKPVLLLGPTGSGKSALISHVANTLGRELTTIHIGEALDGKTLLGGYVATEVPGHFKWVPGALTRAVLNGHWVVIEDLDMASPEVWGIIQPLIQSRKLFIPSRAETISADHGFSLFATATTAPHHGSSSSKSSSSSMISASLSKLEHGSSWTKVVIDPLDKHELTVLVQQAYGLGQLSPIIVSTHEAFVQATNNGSVTIRATERPLTSREVLRWAKRIRHALQQHPSLLVSATSTNQPATEMVGAQIEAELESIEMRSSSEVSKSSSDANNLHRDLLELFSSGRPISSGIRELAVKEAIDVYCSPTQHSSLSESRVSILANFWQLSTDRVEQMMRNRPTLSESDTQCFIGRSTLPINSNPKTMTPHLSNMREVFVPTTSSLGLLEWLSQAIQLHEPVLLVGETGGGKTSTIQHLAARTRHKLVVLNMSQSSDSVDLLGGFKPIDLGMLATPLKNILERIFVKTFSKSKNQHFLENLKETHEKKEWRKLCLEFQKAAKRVLDSYEKKREAEKQSAQRNDESSPTSNQQQSSQRASLLSSSPSEPNVKRIKTLEDSSSNSVSSASFDPSSIQFDDLDESTFPTHLPLEQQWQVFHSRVQKFAVQVDGVKAFQYVEGALVKAVQKGEWVLLDEINLASAETLECLSGLLEGNSLVLSERGDLAPIPRHPDFRLFAAMNPANDVGKSNLPAALRARFSEFYLQELEDKNDLEMIVRGYLKRVNQFPPASHIVDFYLTARKEAETTLVDGSNQKPRYNLRSLSRALEYCADTTALFGFDRALLEGIQLAFLTQLNAVSYELMYSLIHRMVRPKTLTEKLLKTPPSAAALERSDFGFSSSSNALAALPSSKSSNSTSNTTRTSHVAKPITFEQFVLESGPLEPFKDPRFIVTQTTQRHLVHLARALTTRKYPILLQGPTSAGKTSMIEYLAKLTGHRFVRVNNSEQTDLQEYLGQYIHDSQGRLVYHDGVLVEALRHGHWVVLDELNLAPSEVLEALNRLLDDNRQLFVPELQEYITPHPHFCLFATQNPPGLYGGRKVLSRAFRSRFLELHIDDIPDDELQQILEKRSHLAPSFCKTLILIMKDLQRQRQGSKVFAGRHGFVTLRDLFRLADRHPVDLRELAIQGYFLLADRLREPEEREIVKQVLEKHCRTQLDMENIYEEIWSNSINRGNLSASSVVGQQNIVWTKATKRLFGLMSICLRHKEPILLVGPPGTGKTAISQLHAELLSQHLEILNCHQNTETADFIGGLRPIRGKDAIQKDLIASLYKIYKSLFSSELTTEMTNTKISQAIELNPSLGSLHQVIQTFIAHSYAHEAKLEPYHIDKLVNLLVSIESLIREKIPTLPIRDFSSKHKLALSLQLIDDAKEKYHDYSSMFVWYDGPLVRSMKRGHCLLIDEISLAEDAVLERLNSVLEPSRLLVLSEKGGKEIEEMIAHPDFRILATMNPGGDFGKKELSPALRNRFTEIYVPAVDQREDLINIIEKRLSSSGKKSSYDSSFLIPYASTIVDFVEYFVEKTSGTWNYSLRDVLSWADFMIETTPQIGAAASYLHGASMLILDGLGITNPTNADSLKRDALEWLKRQQLPQVDHLMPQQFDSSATAHQAHQAHPDSLKLLSGDIDPSILVNNSTHFGIGSFLAPKTFDSASNNNEVDLQKYSLTSPTTLSNLLRLLRSLQLPKPVLLEGSPGVGKTSIVEALGAACGRKVVRINLSEQTDMLDLLGADLPVEDNVESLQSIDENSSNNAKFEWRDGVFLNALKQGDWVLLDELNLANQSVLEGLNAVLDHRGTVFIPELNASFTCPPTFRIFAAQNPTAQGGGRKGLPKSFLNRFTKVYLDSFSSADLKFIAQSLYPELSKDMINRMVTFNLEMHRATMVTFQFGRDGSPWEFNLRDILRWCKLVSSSAAKIPDPFVDLLYLQRFRTVQDREMATKLFESVFERKMKFIDAHPHYNLTPHLFQVGQSILTRNQRPLRNNYGVTETMGSLGSHSLTSEQNPMILQHLLAPLESLMKCVELNWLAILVGPTASGKTSLLKLLATLTGNTLHTFSVNPSVDTLEILGGFEQIDLNRHSKLLIQHFSALVSHVVRALIQVSSFSSIHAQQSSNNQLMDSNDPNTDSIDKLDSHTTAHGEVKSFNPETAIDEALHLSSMWTLFQTRSGLESSQSSSKSIFSSDAQFQLAEQLLELLDRLIESLSLSGLGSSGDSNISLKQEIQALGLTSTQELRSSLIKIKSLEQKSVSGSFEWVDGLLIEALQRGHWIVMDNVNTCPGPVLDRLLPLLEPNGVLRMNERGLVGGQVSEIVPHPNFRIFFTMDPKYGDISRAMRNRGIEIGMIQIPVEENSVDINNLLSRCLQISSPQLIKKMISFHTSLSKRPAQASGSKMANKPSNKQSMQVESSALKVNDSSLINTSLGLTDLLHWAELTLDQLQRGCDLPTALTLGMEQVYARGQPSASIRLLIRDHYFSHFRNLDLGTHHNQLLLQINSSAGFIDRVTLISPQASALSLNVHSKAYFNSLNSISTLIQSPTQSTPANMRQFVQQSTFYALQHLVERSSREWSNQWAIWLQSHCSVNQSIIFGEHVDKENILNKLIEWMMGQYYESQIVQDSKEQVDKCISTILGPHLIEIISNDVEIHHYLKINESSGIDVRSNHPLWRLLGIVAQKSSDHWKLFMQTTAQLDKLRLFCDSLAHKYMEFIVLQGISVDQKVPISEMSLIEQSLALVQRKVSKSSLTHPIASLLATFFNELDSALNMWITSDELSALYYNSDNINKIKNDFFIVEQECHPMFTELHLLIRLRHQLWSWILATSPRDFELRDFVPVWRWLIKKVQRFEDDFRKLQSIDLSSEHQNRFSITDSLNLVVKHMESIISEELGTKFKSTLWKKEGHQFALKSQSLISLQQQLTSLPVSKHASLHESSNVVLRAMATVLWLNMHPTRMLQDSLDHLSDSSKASVSKSNELKKLLDSLSHIHQTVEETIDHLKEEQVRQNEGKSSSLIESQNQAELKHPLIAPIFEHQLLQLEMFVMQSLQHVLVKESIDSASEIASDEVVSRALKSLESLKPILEKILRISLSKTTCHPKLMSVYQLLLWIIESSASKPSQEIFKVTMSMLRDILSEIRYSFLERSMTNSLSESQLFTSKKRETPFLPPAVIEAQRLAKEKELGYKERIDYERENEFKQEEAKQSQETPANEQNWIRLENAFRSAYLLSRLSDWTSVPVVMRQMRMAQMQHILTHLTSESEIKNHSLNAAAHQLSGSSSLANGSSFIINDWISLIDNLFMTLSCFASPSTDSQDIWPQFFITGRIAVQELMLGRSSSPDFSIKQLERALQLGCEYLIESSTDARFVSISKQVLPSLIQTLIEAVSYAHQYWTQVSSVKSDIVHGSTVHIDIEHLNADRLMDEPLMKRWRGQLLVQLSLLRSTLLVPSEPIDATTKYQSRSDFVQAMQSQVDSRLSILIEAENAFTGDPSNPEIEHEKAVLSKLSLILSQSLERQVCRPPNSPTFHSVWETLQNIFRSHCSYERYQQLMQSFVQLSEAANKGDRMLVATQLPALIVREGQLQNNLQQAITIVRSKYMSFYPDIVGPFISSLIELKRGLRIVRSATEQMTPCQFLVGSANVDSVTSMMTQLQLDDEEAANNSTRTAMETTTTDSNASSSERWSINLSGPSLSCRPDSLFSATAHLQNVISKLIQVPSTVSQDEIGLILSKTTFDSVSALARLNQVHAQAKLVERQLQQNLTKGQGIEAKMTQWMLAASRTGDILKIQSSLLRASLSAVFDHTRRQGYISQDMYTSIDRIFTVFVETYRAAVKEEERKQAAEAEFYKYKVQEHKVEHQHDVEESAFKLMFPDYYKDFEDIVGPEKGKPIDPVGPSEMDISDDEDSDAEGESAFASKKRQEELQNDSPAMMFQGKIYQLNDAEIYQLCRVHFKVFSILRTYLQPGVQELVEAEQNDEIDDIGDSNLNAQQQQGQSTDFKKFNPSKDDLDLFGEISHRLITGNSSDDVDETLSNSTLSKSARLASKFVRVSEERGSAFVSAYETASRLISLLGEHLPQGSQDSSLEASHIIALQKMMDQLTAHWRKKGSQYNSFNGVQFGANAASSQGKKPKKLSRQKRIAARQRRLLAAQSAVVTSYMDNHDLIPNFYTAPNAGEASLLLEPLSEFQYRIEYLLAQEEIGENQILLTLWKLVTRLLEANVNLPLMHFVTGIEILIERSQDWDLYQPAKYTIRPHMDALAKFVTRWRSMELQFWPLLLTTKEQEFQLKAAKWWFHLYSLLHTQVASPENDGLNDVLTAIQEFLESSTYGEYATRLHLLVSFYFQFQSEASLSDPKQENTRMAKLVTILYNVYRYYAQFLPHLQKEMFQLKEAVQTKLEDFIKISKWDDSSFFRLRKSAETSHRNLSRFARQYEDQVLALPMKKLLANLALQENFEALKNETSISLLVSVVPSTQPEPEQEATKKNSKSKKSIAAKTETQDVATTKYVQSYQVMKQRETSLLTPLWLVSHVFGSHLTEELQASYSRLSAEIRSIYDGPTQKAKQSKKSKSPLHQNLASFFKTANELSKQVILPQGLGFSHRAHIQLENLTKDLIEGMLELREKSGKGETPMKKRAFAYMLGELTQIGLDFHTSAVKAILHQQSLIELGSKHSKDLPLIEASVLQDLSYLMSEPIVEPHTTKLLLVAAEEKQKLVLGQNTSTHSSKTASKQSTSLEAQESLNTSDQILTEAIDVYWSKSDEYFYKVLARMIILRDTKHSYSNQLSHAEAAKSLGFAEHVFSLLVHQRRTMTVALERHEKVEKMTNAIQSLVMNLNQFSSEANQPNSSSMDLDTDASSSTHTTSVASLPPQTSSKFNLLSQKEDLDALLCLLNSFWDVASSLYQSYSQQQSTISMTNSVWSRTITEKLKVFLMFVQKATSMISSSKTLVESYLSSCSQGALQHLIIGDHLNGEIFTQTSQNSCLLLNVQAQLSLNSTDKSIDYVIQNLKSQLSLMPSFNMTATIEQYETKRIKTIKQRQSWLASGSTDELELTSGAHPNVLRDSHSRVAVWFESFLKSFSKAIESILLAVQRVHKLEESRMSQERALIEQRKKEAQEQRELFEKAQKEAEEKERVRRAAMPTQHMEVENENTDSEKEDDEQDQQDGDEAQTEENYLFQKREKSKFDFDDQFEELGEDARFLPLHIIETITHLDKLTISLDAPSIISSISEATSILSRSVDAFYKHQSTSQEGTDHELIEMINICRILLQQSYPLLRQWSGIHLSHVHSRALVSKSTSKFAHVLVSVLTTIMKEGFCIPESSSEGEAEQGEKLTDLEGTGLGEGEGDKDVTDQYDEEEQLLGDKPLEDMKEEMEKDSNKPPVDPDTGLEMENDFDGEMRDVEQKSNQDDSQSEEEEDSGDLMDREMGDLDPDQEEVLDEKLWDSDDESEEGDDENGKGKDKYEKNNPLEDNKNDEKEMEARVDDEDFNNDQDNKKEQDKNKKKEKDKNSKDQEGDEQEEGEDGEEDENEGNENDEQNDINNQDEDMYEDSTHKKPHREEEEFELPEDLNLDDGKEDEQEPQTGENEIDDSEDEEQDKMDTDEQPDKFPEQKVDENQNDPSEVKDDPENAQNEDENEQNDQEPENDPNAQAVDEEMLPNDQDGNDEYDDQKDDQEGQEEEQENQISTMPNKNFEKDFSQAYGIQDQDNLPQQQNVKTIEENKQSGGGQDNSKDQNDQVSSNDVQDESSQSFSRSTSQSQPQSSSNSRKQQPQTQKPEPRPSDAESDQKIDEMNQLNSNQKEKDANPLRSLGDALNHWRKKLNVIEDDKNPEEGKEHDDKAENDDEAQNNENNENKAADANQMFEFTKKGEDHDDQTLGIASEEQAEEFNKNKDDIQMKDEQNANEEQNPEKSKENEADGLPSDEINPDDDEKDNKVTVDNKSRAPSSKIFQKENFGDQKAAEENDTEPNQDNPEDVENYKDNNDDMEVDELNYESVVSKGMKEETGEEDSDDEQIGFSNPVELSHDDMLQMRQDLEEMLQLYKNNPDNIQIGSDIWRHLQSLTSSSAQQLCEQLRLLLEPTLKSKMQGDYRTGKRLNMRRVVTYVASQFRKDKIWLRRTMPNKRQYQVLLCLDDSQSVLLGNAAPLMRESTATLCIALQRLQIGQISLLKFGDKVNLLHPFSTPFTDEAASLIMPQLTFEQTTTNMENLMSHAIQMLELSRHEASLQMGTGAQDTMQLMFIIGDGRFGDRRKSLSQWLHRAHQNNIFVVFLLMDTLNKDQSILDTQSIEFDKAGKLQVTNYMDDFPFSYYIILKHLDNLPHILSDALRQWFEIINQKDQRR